MPSDSARAIRVAAGQIGATPMAEADAALARIDAMIARAATAGAELLVLPECAYPAYAIGSPAEYRRGNHMPHSEFLKHLSGVARRHRIHVVCGFVEDTGDRLFNSAAVIAADGRLCGIARKSLMWMMDNKWFAPADQIAPFNTPLGRIGVTICADNRVPEITATLVAKGAEIICVPTCWLDAASDGEACRNPQPEFIIPARSREFGLAHVCADKVGREGEKFGYVGMSLITDAEGNTVELADTESESLIVATVTVGPAKARKTDMLHERVILKGSFVQAESPTEYPRIAMITKPITDRLARRLRADSEVRNPKYSYDLLGWCKARGILTILFHGDQHASPKLRDIVKRQIGIDVTIPPLLDRDLLVGFSKAAMLEVKLMGHRAETFDATRVAALNGVQFVLFRMPTAPIGTLRTRAIENHVYVGALGEDEAILIGPDGRVIAHVKDEPVPLIATLDLKRAANKQVAPLTDIFAQRRPQQYAF